MSTNLPFTGVLALLVRVVRNAAELVSRQTNVTVCSESEPAGQGHGAMQKGPVPAERRKLLADGITAKAGEKSPTGRRVVALVAARGTGRELPLGIRSGRRG